MNKVHVGLFRYQMWGVSDCKHGLSHR